METGVLTVLVDFKIWKWDRLEILHLESLERNRSPILTLLGVGLLETLEVCPLPTPPGDSYLRG